MGRSSFNGPRIDRIPKPARSICLLLALILLGTSCATKALLETTASNPTYTHTTFTERLWESTSEENAIIEIPYSEMPEAALIEDGHEYTKNDERQHYYIHRDSETEMKHKTLRAAATPAAVAADVCIEGVVILVICMIGSLGA